MKEPGNSELIATPLANCWLDGDVLCVKNINCDRTLDNVELHYKILRSALGQKAHPWLKEFPTCPTFDKRARLLAAANLPFHCQALAVVVPAEAVNSMNASFKEVKQAGVPVKVFANEKDARNWLEHL